MDDNIFRKLRIGGKFPEKFKLLEEQIDIEVQKEYFNQTIKIREALPKDFSLEDINASDIENPEISIDAKKELLVKIASLDDPKAYRILEKASKDKDWELHQWCIMALNDNKMTLESSILDENVAFVSTGMGGKGKSLRYFVALVGNNVSEFNEFQQKIIKSEFEYALTNEKSELESIEFSEEFVSLMVLIPFDVPFQGLFKSAIKEANQYGDFLMPNFLVTNTKKLTATQIREIMDGNLNSVAPDSDLDFDDLDDLPDMEIDLDLPDED